MLKITDNIKIAALAILKKVAVKVLKFQFLGKGQTPWAYYQDKNGKRWATFLKKSEFQGYDWNQDYSQVINLETGDTYQVNNHSCTCKDWIYRVKTGQKDKCKHQLMRSEFVKDVEINEEELPTGCFTRKYENSKSIEHALREGKRQKVKGKRIIFAFSSCLE